MQNSIITVRIHAGFNADAFLAGLLALTGQTSGTASAFLAKLFPEIDAEIAFGPRPKDTSTVISRTSPVFSTRAASLRKPVRSATASGRRSGKPKRASTVRRSTTFTFTKWAAWRTFSPWALPPNAG